MTPVSSAVAERSRKNEQVVLQSLASLGQARVAEQLGTSESTVSRMKGNTITEVVMLLAALGLKVVPVDMRCYRAQDIDALLTLAKSRLDSIDRPEQLSWEGS